MRKIIRDVIRFILVVILILGMYTVVGRAAEAEEQIYTTFDGIQYADSDIILLARLISAESRGECYEGQLAVGNNVINRVKDCYYPDTIHGVIFQRHQYSVTDHGLTTKYTDSAYSAAYDILVNGVRILPYWTLYFQRADRDENKYIRIEHHTFNYEVRSSMLSNIWYDTVEEPQYFIDRLTDRQIERALESMPPWYGFDWETRTVYEINPIYFKNLLTNR